MKVSTRLCAYLMSDLVTLCYVGEVIEDLFFIELLLHQLLLGDGKLDILQLVLSISDPCRNGGG